MLPGEQQRLLKRAERACGLARLAIRGNELLHQGPLLCHTLFNFSDMPPCGIDDKLIHL